MYVNYKVMNFMFVIFYSLKRCQKTTTLAFRHSLVVSSCMEYFNHRAVNILCSMFLVICVCVCVCVVCCVYIIFCVSTTNKLDMCIKNIVYQLQ